MARLVYTHTPLQTHIHSPIDTISVIVIKIVKHNLFILQNKRTSPPTIRIIFERFDSTRFAIIAKTKATTTKTELKLKQTPRQHLSNVNMHPFPRHSTLNNPGSSRMCVCQNPIAQTHTHTHTRAHPNSLTPT